jgi:CheY-like chemotaxis protein
MKRKEPDYKYRNVMLIDDNDLDNFINVKTLEANHFAEKIYTNTSAQSAIEFLNNLVTLGQDFSNIFPEVILVDINMPMMDGFQFIEAFKQHAEKQLLKPKLVILTSSVYHEDRQKALSISPEIIFLNKPLTREMLTEVK